MSGTEIKTELIMLIEIMGEEELYKVYNFLKNTQQLSPYSKDELNYFHMLRNERMQGLGYSMTKEQALDKIRASQ